MKKSQILVKSFSELGLSESVLQAIEEVGYNTPTHIQARIIPSILQGHDVFGCAQTGTGKTASFILPMIDKLAKGRAKARMPRSLVLAPTRELAAQVEENFTAYSKYCKLKQALLIGGTALGEQEKSLARGVDVLIATPGRFLDLFDRGKILLHDIKVLVIDEADRMLDMGFMPDIERVLSILPSSRQTLLFSATVPPEVRRLSQAFLNNPIEVTITPQATPAETIIQQAVCTSIRNKNKSLREILTTKRVQAAIIFCNRKRDANMLCTSLKRHGFKAEVLHGDLSQEHRTMTLEAFKKGEVSLLVASDVAARGIDVEKLSYVFNFDVPISSDDYIHRIGRTGRAGQQGIAITFVTPAEQSLWENILRKTQAKIKNYNTGEPLIADELTEETSMLKKSTESKAQASAKGESKEKHRKAAQSPVPSQDEGKSLQKKPRSKERNLPPLPDVSVLGFGEDVPAFFKLSSLSHLISSPPRSTNRGKVL